MCGSNQGWRAPLRFALIPGYYISRPWRSISQGIWDVANSLFDPRIKETN